MNPSVVRIGDTVRRTPSEATPAVHDLLRHLEAKGFDGAPRALGFDEHGREVLSFIDGDGLARRRMARRVASRRGPRRRRRSSSRASTTPSPTTCRPTSHQARSCATAIRDRGTSSGAATNPSRSSTGTSRRTPSRSTTCRTSRSRWCRCATTIAVGQVGFSGAARSRPTSAPRVRHLRSRARRPTTLIDLAERHQQADIDEIEERGPWASNPCKTFWSKASHEDARPHARVATAPPRAAARLSAGDDATEP